MAKWIYTHYQLNTYQARCSKCSYTEFACDDLERKVCPKCKSKMKSYEDKKE